jgi:hypothetical protein
MRLRLTDILPSSEHQAIQLAPWLAFDAAVLPQINAIEGAAPSLPPQLERSMKRIELEMQASVARHVKSKASIDLLRRLNAAKIAEQQAMAVEEKKKADAKALRKLEMKNSFGMDVGRAMAAIKEAVPAAILALDIDLALLPAVTEVMSVLVEDSDDGDEDGNTALGAHA